MGWKRILTSSFFLKYLMSRQGISLSMVGMNLFKAISQWGSCLFTPYLYSLPPLLLFWQKRIVWAYWHESPSGCKMCLFYYAAGEKKGLCTWRHAQLQSSSYYVSHTECKAFPALLDGCTFRSLEGLKRKILLKVQKAKKKLWILRIWVIYFSFLYITSTSDYK